MRRQFFGSIVLVGFALVGPETFWWGNRVVERMPSLGDPLPCDPNPALHLLISSAQFAPSCLALLNGVAFDIASDSRSKVVYIGVDDPLYRTPEGIHPGSRLKDVLATGAAEPLPERGWAFHTRMKSGWNAAFVNGPTMTIEPLPRDSKVKWLYKR